MDRRLRIIHRFTYLFIPGTVDVPLRNEEKEDPVCVRGKQRNSYLLCTHKIKQKNNYKQDKEVEFKFRIKCVLSLLCHFTMMKQTCSLSTHCQLNCGVDLDKFKELE